MYVCIYCLHPVLSTRPPQDGRTWIDMTKVRRSNMEMPIINETTIFLETTSKIWEFYRQSSALNAAPTFLGLVRAHNYYDAKPLDLGLVLLISEYCPVH